MHQIKRYALLLLILAIALWFLFFSHHEERDPALHIERQQQQIRELTAAGETAGAMKQEFELGLYYEKLGEYDKAVAQFERVFRFPYPDMHYGYLHDEAQWKIRELHRLGLVSDTTAASLLGRPVPAVDTVPPPVPLNE
jgi:tetratricopeptide (TPR) repeat protein